jgi:hypothetical protein
MRIAWRLYGERGGIRAAAGCRGEGKERTEGDEGRLCGDLDGQRRVLRRGVHDGELAQRGQVDDLGVVVRGEARDLHQVRVDRTGVRRDGEHVPVLRPRDLPAGHLSAAGPVGAGVLLLTRQ